MTGLGREHQLMPGPLGDRPSDEPHFFLGSQGVAGKAEQRQLSPSGGGLDRSDVQAVPGAHELLADPDDAVLEVDIAPAQPEYLAAAHAPTGCTRACAPPTDPRHVCQLMCDMWSRKLR
jgi:hypothetical protein